MMDGDFPESPLSADCHPQQEQNLGGPVQDEEDRRLTGVRRARSDLQQNQADLLVRDEDPGLDPCDRDQGEDAAETRRDWSVLLVKLQLHFQIKPISLSMNSAELDQTDRGLQRSRASQEAGPESGGGVPALVISGAAEQVSRDRKA